jgi:hypothetical protein
MHFTDDILPRWSHQRSYFEKLVPKPPRLRPNAYPAGRTLQPICFGS